MRGQIDYPFLLVFVVLICSGFLIVKMQDKVAFQRDAGGTQAAVLRVNHDVLLYDSFVEDAAKQVISSTLKEQRRTPGLFFRSVDDDLNCAVLNDPREPRVLVAPNVQQVMSEVVTAGVQPYLADYAGKFNFESSPTEFEVGVEKGALTVVALEPAVFEVFDLGGVQVGKVGYRPAFRINMEHGLERYAQSVEELNFVAEKCSYLPDPVACAVEQAPDWAPEAIGGDKAIFSPAKGVDQPCFELFLPPQSKQPELDLSQGETAAAEPKPI